MVRNREEAAKRAEASHTNTPNTCQAWTRGLFDAPSAGDQDRDGDADAVDGWKSEPVSARHTDRHPPRGVPVAWSGGSRGNGHRAMSLGHGNIRSTDAAGSGRVATVDLGWVERNWGLHYLGWSETIDGFHSPVPPKPKPKSPTRISAFLKGGPRWNVALLDRAVKGGRVGTVKQVRDSIDAQVRRLPHDKGDSRVNYFVSYYKKHRVLTMGQLNLAVKHGRRWRVMQVRNEIRRQISKLPKR